jgi:hypothetical protein
MAGSRPTIERWQDKSREARGGRVAQERRQIRYFVARGATKHDSLQIHATPWKIETTCTSRAVASCAQSHLMHDGIMLHQAMIAWRALPDRRRSAKARALRDRLRRLAALTGLRRPGSSATTAATAATATSG